MYKRHLSATTDSIDTSQDTVKISNESKVISLPISKRIVPRHFLKKDFPNLSEIFIFLSLLSRTRIKKGKLQKFYRRSLK